MEAIQLLLSTTAIRGKDVFLQIETILKISNGKARNISSKKENRYQSNLSRYLQFMFMNFASWFIFRPIWIQQIKTHQDNFIPLSAVENYAKKMVRLPIQCRKSPTF